MTVAVLADISQDWAQQVRAIAGERAMILEARSLAGGLELLQIVPADMIIVELSKPGGEGVRALNSAREQSPDAVRVCIAAEDVIRQVRREGMAEPDVWLQAEADAGTREQALRQALNAAELRGEIEAMQDGPGEGAPVVPGGEERRGGDLEALHRVMGGVAGGFDLDRLLEAYVDAVRQYSQCASYCLLWEDEDGALRVRNHRGVRSEVVEGARLCPSNALPTWYRRNRRVVTVAELSSWPDRKRAVAVRREMALLGGQVALPLMVRGRLAGIMMLGEKVLGESYSTGEIEVLFSVSSHVALAAEGIELHEELGRAKAYTDRIVESVGAGLITLGPDDRIRVLNPYAAEVLGLEQTQAEGADLRALPSPLGDMLYAALHSSDAGANGEEVTIRGGSKTLRVTTSPLTDADGTRVGSVLMLDDITAEQELARERSRRERLDVATKIVGRIAHEVKNPLTAVKTYAELMSSGRGHERLAEFWSDTVLPQIDRLDEMLKNLLRMVEQPPPSPEATQVRTLVSEAVDVLPMEEQIKRQSFDLQFADDLPPVLVDPRPTRDALSYLMRYLAGPDPKPVQVNVERSAHNPSQVEIALRRRNVPNGKIDRETLFDPLAAMQDPDTDLGPVISQKIIANQRGQVDALVEDGWFTMRVMLPRFDQHDAPAQEV